LGFFKAESGTHAAEVWIVISAFRQEQPPLLSGANINPCAGIIPNQHPLREPWSGIGFLVLALKSHISWEWFR
jgi:hypothetical protein